MNWQALRFSALWCWHQLLTLALVVLVLVAVIVGMGRQFLPVVDQYQGDVERWLSVQMGLPVRLQSLQGEWEGLGPHFTLQGMELRDPRQPQQALLTVPEIELRPSLWQSLRHFEPRLDVRVRGLNVHLDQSPDGRLQLRELAGLSRHDPEAAAKALRFVLRQPALALQESRVVLALTGHPAVTLSGIDLVNRNHGDSHQLAGHLRVPASRDALRFQLDLQGDALDWQHAELSVWMHVPVMTLDKWLPTLEAGGLRLVRLEGGGDYWLHFRQGRLRAVQAQLEWRDVVFEGPHARHHVQGMRGQLAWSESAEGWQLSAQQLLGTVDELPWPVPVLALRSGPAGLTVAGARVNVGGLSSLLSALPLPPSASSWLREASPSGELAAVRLDLQQSEPSVWKATRVEAEATSLSVRATTVFPGVQGLAGWVRWTPEAGWLGLNTGTAELDLRQYLREPVAINQLQGHLRWRAGDMAWHLDSDRLQLSNPDARGEAVLSLTIPRDDPAAAHLSLLAGIREAKAASTWRYVPWPVAGDKTLDWLRRSILAGKVNQGDFLYEGPLHGANPADTATASHRLLMRFDLAGARLDYEKGWPELRDLDATVTLDGLHLDIQGRSASLLGATQGSRLSAAIPDLSHPVLAVQADVSSTGPDVMRLFRESPLRQALSGLDDALALEGPLAGTLKLSIPLQQGLPEVEVSARLKDNRLLLKQADLAATGLEGELRYHSRTGLLAEHLTARLLDESVVASISSQMHRGELAEVNVVVDGKVGVPALRPWTGPGVLNMVSGSTPYQASISIASSAAPVRLLLTSPLTGLQVNLPPPLGKTATETLPLRYQGSFGAGEQMARLQYGQRLSAGLVWSGSRLDRALVRLQGTAVAWPQHAGLEIEGSMTRFDWHDWEPLLERFRQPAASVSVHASPALPTLTRLNLKVRDIFAEGLHVQNAEVALTRQPGAWKMELGADELAGTALVPDAPGSEIRLAFSRLQWPLPRAALSVAGKAASTNPVAGLGTRLIQIDGTGLRLGDWPGLGALAVGARLLPSPYGLRVEDMTIDSSVLDFKGRMDWQWRGGVSTRLRGHAVSGNVAGLLSAFGYAPSMVSPKATAEFDLGWPGSPEALVLAGLEGSMTLSVEQGRLLNISNTATASRVFGWFDVDNIRRRFKGDFSDVLRRGLSFDKASLSGPLQAGVMQPAVLSVDGPTLKADGRGRLDLGKQQMDQEFTVLVPVSSAVPIAAVVVGGPLIGGAVAAAQMAFQKQIDKVTQLRYHVSGDWANPRVERTTVKVLELKTAKHPADATGNGLLPVANNGSKP